MVQKRVVVRNECGLHTRAAAQFVKQAGIYLSCIRIIKNGQVADGKSILSIMMLGATEGSNLTITAEGPDEVQALESLSELVVWLDGQNEPC